MLSLRHFIQGFIVILITSLTGPAVADSATLVWLVVNNAEQKKALVSETSSSIPNEFKRQVPNMQYVFPLLDLEDQQQVTGEDIAAVARGGSLSSPIVNASRRYQAQNLLIGQLQQDKNHLWQGQWLWVDYSHFVRWHEVGATLSDIFTRTSLDIQKIQKQTIPTVAKKLHTISLQIAGVEDAAMFQKVLQYLESIPTVVNVSVVSIEGDKVVVVIQYAGQPTILQDFITHSKYLRANSNPAIYDWIV